MQVLPHVYYTIDATDLILPSDMKKREERGWALKNIPAAADNREDPFNALFIMSKEEKQKTTRELITAVQNFCRNLHDMSDDYTTVPYVRPTYNIRMSRNAMVHIFDNLLGGVSVSNTMKLNATNDGKFDFVYNRANKVIYKSNIRQVLGQDFEKIHLLNYYNYVAYNQESNIRSNAPLYVCKYDDKEVYVKEIADNTIVVNDKLCEIYPKVTGHIPAHMSHLFNNKTEPVLRAYHKHYWMRHR